jgi:IS1 family transposase
MTEDEHDERIWYAYKRVLQGVPAWERRRVRLGQKYVTNMWRDYGNRAYFAEIGVDDEYVGAIYSTTNGRGVIVKSRFGVEVVVQE